MFSQSVDHVEKDIESKSNEAWTYKKVFHNQNFVVLSIIDASEKTVTKEDGTTETTKLPPSIKIFGTFSSLEEANRHSKKINTENDFFHVYVADTNEWLPIPPTAEFIEDVEYQEERLQGIKKAYTDMRERSAKEVADKIKKEDRLQVEESLAGISPMKEIGVEETKKN